MAEMTWLDPSKQPTDVIALPGQGVPQPTAAQRAAIEATWNQLATLRQSLQEIMAVFDRHPELVEWIRGSIEQKMAGPK